jgi:hypothetical protein
MRTRVGICALIMFLVNGVASAQQAEEPTPAHAPASRLVLGPTARLPAPNTGQLVGFFAYGFPAMQFGISPRVGLTLGTSAFSALCLCGPMILVAPKVQLASRGRTTLAGGVAHLFMPGDERGRGYTYVVSTYGSTDNAVTIGGGAFYGDGATAAVVTIGAERRLSPRVVWVTENYIARRRVMTSGGFRVHGTHWGVDMALAWFIGGGQLTLAPVLNVVRSF